MQCLELTTLKMVINKYLNLSVSICTLLLEVGISSSRPVYLHTLLHRMYLISDYG